MNVDTETTILNSIPDFDSPETETDDVSSTTQETGQETASEGTDTSQPTAATTGEGSGTDTQAQPTANTQPATTRRDGLVEKPNANDPRAKDLVDPNTGQVVARGGIERRIFEGAQRLHRDNQQLTQRLQQAEVQIAAATDIVKLGNTLNLSTNDQQASFNLMSQFLKDPVKMLEQLVIEVKSKGYPIPFLEQGITAGMDTAAIQRMMDNKLAPITNMNRAQEQQQQVQLQAKKTLDTFLDANPEGEHNLTVLAEMMNAQPGLSIENAYTRMIKWCASNGLDYSQPLKPQIERAQQTNQPAKLPAQTPTQPLALQAPLPNGRQTNGAVPVNKAQTYDENSSWADIIRGAMRETGMSSNQ